MVSPSHIEKLKKIVGDRNVLLAPEELLAYSYDTNTLYRHWLEVVVLSQTVEQISRIVKAPTILSDNITVAGDGNIHPSLQTDINDNENFERALKAVDDMVVVSLELGGVISGEHGVGLEKRCYMKLGLEPAAQRIMHDIKKDLDPHDILNPGKYWKDE